MYAFIKPVLTEAKLKSIKISYSPAHWEFKNLCFVTIALTESVLHAFFYNLVKITKIITISLTKLLHPCIPSYLIFASD